MNARFVERSFLAGRSMGQAVTDARTEARVLLGSYGLWTASRALDMAGMRAFLEWIQIRQCMLAGGYHRVRLAGGRGIDR